LQIAKTEKFKYYILMCKIRNICTKEKQRQKKTKQSGEGWWSGSGSRVLA
jgi:hypothetical protein